MDVVKENIAGRNTDKEGVMVRLERNEEMIAAVETVSSNLSTDSGQLLPPLPELREEVDSLIEQGFTDLWLLLAGEGLGAVPYKRNHDGQPFAMVFGGQIHLLESKFFALDALRSVGLDLSAQDPNYEG
ncbi:MAG TPA: hypothetical protein VNQ79_22490 [Blastocatellia bacterium]|nr:hypothetical protein [Blastocatellia bacterium]